MKYFDPKEGHRLDRAINFLVTRYEKSGFNPKPVVFHSLNVAMYLFNLNYHTDLVETAILHDLIEDSDTTKEDIEKAFGSKIAEWVDVLSFKTTIEDKEARYKEMFARIKDAGRDTLIIKCADILSNSFYIRLVEDPSMQKFLIEKLNYFLELSKDEIGEEPVWNDLYAQSIAETRRQAGEKV